MSYQGIERDFSQLHMQDRGGNKMPPALAPKPKPYNPAPAPYQPGGSSYRPIYHEVDDFPPPPPQSDDHSYPPPPPPEHVRGYMYHDAPEEFPPPPPISSQGYEIREAHFAGPGSRSGNYANQPYHDPPVSYKQDYGPSSYPVATSQSNYMNISVVKGDRRDYPQAEYKSQMLERAVPGPQVPIGLGSDSGSKGSPGSGGKEAEVDDLTRLLMQSMESSGDPDFFGMCSKCGKTVCGESNGCKAMDQVFHINCFTCVGCNTQLQGKTFFQLENKPYCEPCYMNTLEKCSICSKPITDRLLRATGKPYHPDCFVCVVCGKSLDGVPFTVDATNQIHCIEDFHKKFAPRCCVCQHPIMPDRGQEETVRIVAMDKSFHVDCYRCEDCGLQLSSEAEGRGCYPLDDHILCKNCNAKRIQHMTTKMATEL
ncbi:lipoma-preferred partner homolog isoform X2 [Gigantopelta aegis]|uniref:lipoma-preferred partner homolog isoform X1 n=1 Tax=Gigantopelta aegis TaxID=1735272 RepID=UPI001B88E15A|nr:lipoma-preferred partner homolog isoform X1 [Gigantopelta aegis]XP_041378330.1 lipoma-preferred partner homolog isoform X2 [Gigantopelta aegis]